MFVDKTSVTLVDHMGDDLTTVNAARVSFHKMHTSLDEKKDPRLIKYLADHEHTSPFKHAALSFHIKAPIFVARQLVKHEYLVMNEVSRRYVDSSPEFWLPLAWREWSEDKKQGSGGSHPSKAVQERCKTDYKYSVTIAVRSYKQMLRDGIAPEQARMVLPQSMMTEWYWTGLLGSWAKMCKLRLKADAQAETRLVAEQVYEVACEKFPLSFPALVGDV